MALGDHIILQNTLETRVGDIRHETVLIIHSINICIFAIPATIVGTGDTAANKTSKNSCLHESCIPVRIQGRQKIPMQQSNP